MCYVETCHKGMYILLMMQVLDLVYFLILSVAP